MRKSKPSKTTKPSKKSKKIEVDDGSIGEKTDLLNSGTIEVLPDPVGDVVEDDEVTVYRDIMIMTDDERFSSDDNSGLSSIRLTLPPPPQWYDDASKVKFKVGQLVIFKGVKTPTIHYVRGPSKKENYYVIIPDKSLKDIVVSGDEIKVAPKDSKWTKYWDTVPVIKAPSWADKEKIKTDSVNKNPGKKPKKK